MPYPCFSYPGDVQPGGRKRDAGQASPSDPQIGYPCFSYSKLCFSYPAEVPPGTRTRNAAQSAQSGVLNCFSYTVTHLLT